ncbi:hypothetical protein ILUMI_25189 [Ignelater luminosus]|uniref:Survival of motor neuron-related-splicing factor 30 n=1 Tax=Ignelater luminosus TaxID=2038154 RepID=A0A8K0C5U3_IGNLU|nr:hypothetical protein ILUMI_25189 [Ignelater luminosus]
MFPVQKYISKEGYNLISEDGTVKHRKNVFENALNTDIKEFGESVLTNLLKQGKTGKVVLQIQKIRNVSAPKSKEDSQAAPRMLKLILTDGHTSCQAIEISNISSLSRIQTPPGSKLLINNARIFSNCILLHPNCCILLGGQVPVLFEKWELAKNMSAHIRTSAGPDGPPPWVNFGEKIVSSISNEPFKSLTSKIAKETTNDFDVHRQDAIANATSGAVKRVFGGGARIAQDNQLTNFRKGGNFARGNNENQNMQEYQRGYKSKRENKEKVNANEKPQKPPEKISLFDFLENKLLVNENTKSVGDSSLLKQEVQRINTQQKDPQRNNVMMPNPGIYQQNYSSNNASKTASNSENSTNLFQHNKHVNNSNIEAVTKGFGKVSLNSQFASRSLQQHLNLAKNKNENFKPKTNTNQNWKVGDLCLAKYWEDGKFYNATITNLTDRTCVVQFNGYGNVEEVLKTDCLPISDSGRGNITVKSNANRNYQGNAGYYNNRRTYSNSRSFNYKGT